ncbi:VanZ family protein [Actinoplanes sp. G11-F43]|uniref:VanZ family protein n=1 Tax=Actinoplanes sp. G11-F43 TaxID=3424130 RepID=UPI003D331961
MFREVPVLPVVIPVAVVVLLALVWHLHRRNLLTAARFTVAVALCVYAAGVIANTVFPIFLDMPARDMPWHSALVLVPLADYEIVDAVMNIVIFVPVGMLVPLLVARASWWRVVGVGAFFSLAIEVSQFVTAHLLGGGHIADVNDLLSNTVGGALGFALFSAALRVPGVAAFADRFRWAEPDRPR